MQDPADNQKQSGDLHVLARERDFDALEAAWMRRLDPEPRDLDELFRVAGYLARRKFPEQAEVLLWSLVATVTEKADAARALEVAKRAALIAPEAESLREEVVSLYKAVWPETPNLDGILEASGIASGGEIQEAIRRIDYCIRLRPGAFVLHVRSRRVGRVEAFSEGKYSIESEGRRHDFSLEQVTKTWEPVDADDFRGRVVYDRDRLKQMAVEDPAQLMEMVLKSGKGKADFKQIKHVLIPAVIPNDGWSAWWNSVKVKLKRSPHLEISAGTQPQFSLRDAGREYADVFRTRFEKERDPYARVSHVMQYLSETASDDEGDPAMLAFVGEALLAMENETQDPGVALAALSCARELHERFPSASVPGDRFRNSVASVADWPAVFSGITGEDISRMILNALRAECPDAWPEIYAQVFPVASLRLCDMIARALLDAGNSKRLRAAAERAVSLPDQYTEAVGWVWRQLLSENEAIGEMFDRISVTLTLLHLLNRFGRIPKYAENRAELRLKLTRLRSIVAASDCRGLRALIAKADVASARRLHDAIQSNEGLLEHDQHELVHALRDRFPDEFIQKKDLWDDGHIYSTAEGLERRHVEFAKLVNEDMRKNAEAIGRAADRGDLRENWEYKAALEERDRLVERAARTRKELDLARVIDADMIPDGQVSVGTVVGIRDAVSGDNRKITFLGPWDADITHGVYSYLAPLSLRFMGKKLGDSVRASFNDAEADYEIVSIEKVLR